MDRFGSDKPDLRFGMELKNVSDVVKDCEFVVFKLSLIHISIVKLIEKMGGEVVKICCVMELAGLKGREKLNGYAVDALITYEGK